jgi:transposase
MAPSVHRARPGRGLQSSVSRPCRGCAKKNAAQALGRSRGGLRTPIHALVESTGRLQRCFLTGGAVHVTQAEALIEGIAAGAVIADKAFDADPLIQRLRARGARGVIPPRSNRLEARRFDRRGYRQRNFIERCFCRLQHFRRVATRDDKLAQRYSSFIALTAAVVWLR